MKNFAKIFTCIVLFGWGCGASKETKKSSATWDELGEPANQVIKPGVPVYPESRVEYRRNGHSVMTVRLTEPSVVDVATKPEKWGFFQFPTIYRNLDNDLVAKWNMAADAVESYGKGGHRLATSKDGGKSWAVINGEPPVGGGLTLQNGDLIEVYTPPALKVEELKLPKPLGANKEAYGRRFVYYRLNELPDNLRGVYLNRLRKGDTKWIREHAVLEDSLAVRYTDSNMFPVVWWGDMHIAKDSSIIAGIYPGFYENQNGGVDPSGIIFYRSVDQGRTWKHQGRIPYIPDLSLDSNGAKRLALGFTEPAFEILSDGSFLCVMRTTDGLGNSPMYISRSTDLGVTWTKPAVFTNAGVLPRLLQLDNGVVVLASGRPGVQLRFSLDGKGNKWTDPFEMLAFENTKEAVSCGYPEILASGPDKFLLIYSDFNFKNQNNETRKAIKVREVTVTPN